MERPQRRDEHRFGGPRTPLVRWSGYVHTPLSTIAIGIVLAMSAAPASAQVSAKDGYGADGGYQWNFEIDPYAWLPASTASFSAGHSGQIAGSTSSSIPSAQQLAQTLHGAFMGYGIARYGPFSGEVDFQWVTASEGKTIGPDARGRTAGLSLSESMVRVAPGIGYQVYNGAVAGLPVTLDARTGFSWIEWSASATSALTPIGLNPSGSFVQPWLGLRASLYPAPNWRVVLDALGQGFGVDGGSWGWGTSLIATYSVNAWFDVSLGFRALNTTRYQSNAGPFNAGQRSFDLTAYGPVLGVGFRF